MTERVVDDGRVVFRNITTGQLGSVPAADVAQFENDPDFAPVDATEYAAEKARAENEGIGAQLETLGRGAAEGLGDVVSVLGRPVARAAIRSAGALYTGLGGDPSQAVDPAKLEQTLYRSAPSLVAGALAGGDLATKEAAADAYQAQSTELRQANPGAWTAGNIAGQVVPGLLTGGLAASGGKAIAGALGRGGLGTTAANVAGAGLATAAEGGLYGAAMAEGGARESGQTDGATAEQLLQGIGLGALIGGGAGAALSGTGAAFRRLMAKAEPSASGVAPGAAAKEATKEAAEAADKALVEKIADQRLPKIWSQITGADEEFLQKAGAQNWSKEAAEIRSLGRNRAQIVDEAVPVVTNAVNDLLAANSKVRESVDQFIPRADGIRKLLVDDGVDMTSAKQVGLAQLKQTRLAATDVLSRIRDDDPAFATIRKRVSRYVDFLNEKTRAVKSDANADAADINAVSNLVKQEAQKLQKTLQGAITSPDPFFREEAKKVWQSIKSEVEEPLRKSLEDASVWGTSGTAQKEINRAYKASIDSSERYESELLMISRNTDWSPEARHKSYADSGKVKSWVESIGTASGQTRQEMVRAHVDDLKNFIGAVEKYHPLDVSQRKAFEAAVEASKALEEHLIKLDKTAGIANKYAELARAEAEAAPLAGSIFGRAIEGVTGAVAGTLAAGPMGGLMGAAGFLTRPMAAMNSVNQIQTLAQRIGVSFEKEASKIVLGTAKPGLVTRAANVAGAPVRAAAKAAPATAVAVFMGKHATLPAAYEKKSQELIRVSNDPSSLIDSMSRVTGGLQDVAPGVAGALVAKATGAVSFLASKLPAGTLDPTALLPQRKSVVPEIEMRKFARTWAAVERPMSVLEDLQKGLATPDQIEALRVVHPETYQAIRSAVTQALIDLSARGGKVPLATRQQLDLLLDLDGAGEPALGPKISSRIATLQDAKAKPQSQSTRPHKAPNLTAAMRLPQDRWSA